MRRIPGSHIKSAFQLDSSAMARSIAVFSIDYAQSLTSKGTRIVVTKQGSTLDMMFGVPRKTRASQLLTHMIIPRQDDKGKLDWDSAGHIPSGNIINLSECNILINLMASQYKALYNEIYALFWILGLDTFGLVCATLPARLPAIFSVHVSLERKSNLARTLLLQEKIDQMSRCPHMPVQAYCSKIGRTSLSSTTISACARVKATHWLLFLQFSRPRPSCTISSACLKRITHLQSVLKIAHVREFCDAIFRQMMPEVKSNFHCAYAACNTIYLTKLKTQLMHNADEVYNISSLSLQGIMLIWKVNKPLSTRYLKYKHWQKCSTRLQVKPQKRTVIQDGTLLKWRHCLKYLAAPQTIDLSVQNHQRPLCSACIACNYL